jgi:hypothetical protein
VSSPPRQRLAKGRYRSAEARVRVASCRPTQFSATAARNGWSGWPCSDKLHRYPREACVARYYDPATGQFLSIDPDVAQTEAPFDYTGDDPVNEVDPTGLLFGISFGGLCIRYVTCPGSTPKAHIDQDIANFAGGVLNGITFGNGRTVASWFGVQCNADWSSTATEIGTVVGSGLDLGLGPEEIPEDLAAEGVAGAAELSPTIEVDGTTYVYGQRVLSRAAEETGPYHNFPYSFDSEILGEGTRTELGNGYVEYTLPGSVNGVEGTFEIGVRPSNLSSGEMVITHRFFVPGG